MAIKTKIQAPEKNQSQPHDTNKSMLEPYKTTQIETKKKILATEKYNPSLWTKQYHAKTVTKTMKKKSNKMSANDKNVAW